MTGRMIWTHYGKPPEACAELVEKECTHNTCGVKVKVLSLHLYVEHIRATYDVKFGDVPSMGIPTLMFEVLTGDSKGQVLLMSVGHFQRFFTVNT